MDPPSVPPPPVPNTAGPGSKAGASESRSEGKERQTEAQNLKELSAREQAG